MSRVGEKPLIDPLEDRDLLAEIVRALVDLPGQVRVEESRGDESTLLVVHCAENDRGKVIGREGRTMNAIRVILGRVAAVEGRKVYIQMASGPRSAPADPG
jgi:predicted RNA-binding protein YlqC (UPF0109 family)